MVIMPYIDTHKREILKNSVEQLTRQLQSFNENEIEGVLNYVITTVICKGIKGDNKWKYRYINRAMGVLECVKSELYRRVAILYENLQVIKNGDIDVFDPAKTFDE